MGYSVVNVDELDATGPGGAVRFVRRALGVQAFGINWIEIPPNTEGREHNEQESGQEEVNIVIGGSGVYRIDGEEIAVREGTFLRFDSETTRMPIAGPRGLTLVAVGAQPGCYEPRGPF